MATAVSLRKGTYDEHQRFHGDLGEVTFCTDNNPTLYIHNGDDKVGTPLARADMENVSTENIAKRGIAKSDLTNVMIPNDKLGTVKVNLNGLNYAQRDMSDVNTLDLLAGGAHVLGPDLARADSMWTYTTNLAEGNEDSRNPEIYGKNLAYSDLTNVRTEDVVRTLTTTVRDISISQTVGSSLSNINVDIDKFDSQISSSGTYSFIYTQVEDPEDPQSTILAWTYNSTMIDKDDFGITYTGTPIEDDVLTVIYTNETDHLYADKHFGNINTSDLASGAGTTGKHSGLNLAYANLSNLEPLAPETRTALYNQHVQLTDNLTQNIDTGTNSEYPSAAAVRTKIESLAKIPEFNQLGTEGYQVLITSFIYNYQITKVNEGQNYQVNDELTLVDENKHSIGITLNILETYTDDHIDPDTGEQVIIPGRILRYEVITTYGNRFIPKKSHDGIMLGYDCAVNLVSFANLPELSSAVENRVFTIEDAFVTTADFIDGPGVNYPANSMAKCIDTQIIVGEPPIYKWEVVTEPQGAQFDIESVTTGVVPGVNSQISWINLENPITIRDTQMEDSTGIITVVFSRNPANVLIKKLIGGDTILGDTSVSPDGWSPRGITMTFTPAVPADVLLDSWVIVVN